MKAWSYSALNSFETCPRKHHEVSILKNFQEKPNPAMKEGNDIHKDLEKYAKHGVMLPSRSEPYKPLVDKLLNIEGTKLFEEQVALDENFNRVGYWDKDVWVRAKLDVAVLQGDSALIVDYKTGKVKEDMGQLVLSALIARHAFAISSATVMFAWLGHGSTTKEVIDVSDPGRLWSPFLSRVEDFQRAFRTGDFPARPSGLCKNHCPVTSCEFYGKGRYG